MKAGAVAALLVAAMVVEVPERAAAQNAPRTPPASSRGRLAVTGCSGQPISEIVVITQPPFADRLPAQVEWARTTVRALHTNTAEDVVRRFLLLRVGEPCNQIRRAESERILRAQPFLVDARIHAYDDEQGGVRLEVETRDDVTLLVAPHLRGSAPMLRGLDFEEGNIAGRAMRGALQWRDGGAYRDVLGVAYNNYQFGAARNELRVVAEQVQTGHRVDVQALRPFYTDLQRYAWIVQAGAQRDVGWLDRLRDYRGGITLDRAFTQVGGIQRFGPVGRLKLLGLSLTREFVTPGTAIQRFTPAGRQDDTLGAVLPILEPQRSLRANALLGLRAIRFVRVQGFDALTGAQDVRVGMQLGVVAGQSLQVGRATDRDRLIATNLYLGAGTEKWFLGAQGITEASYDLDERAWRNMVGSGRIAYYFRPAVRQTTVLEGEWSEGRHMRAPFQLSLAERHGGLLGHVRSQATGTRRLVLRGEQRLVIPTRFNVGDAGLATFVEGGRLWRDHAVPMSMGTAWQGAAGVSLLAALPPRSRRLWRVDFAFPFGPDPDKRFQVRLSSSDRSRSFWTEPPDITRGRERTAPTSLFTWP